MARLVQLNGAHQGRIIDLVKGRSRLGRHPDNEIRLEDQGISSFHAEIQVAEIGVHLKDCGSTNGTYVNGQRFVRGMLSNGQDLTIGCVSFRVELQATDVGIVVNLPTAPVERLPNFLEGGIPACQIHSETLAGFECTKCGITLCPACVRRTGLAGSSALYFCLECSGKCVVLEEQVVAPAKKTIFSKFSKLSDTLHLARPGFLDFRKKSK